MHAYLYILEELQSILLGWHASGYIVHSFVNRYQPVLYVYVIGNKVNLSIKDSQNIGHLSIKNTCFHSTVIHYYGMNGVSYKGSIIFVYVMGNKVMLSHSC